MGHGCVQVPGCVEGHPWWCSGSGESLDSVKKDSPHELPQQKPVSWKRQVEGRWWIGFFTVWVPGLECRSSVLGADAPLGALTAESHMWVLVPSRPWTRLDYSQPHIEVLGFGTIFTRGFMVFTLAHLISITIGLIKKEAGSHYLWANRNISIASVSRDREPRGLFQYKSLFRYRNSQCKDKIIIRPSYLHNGNSYTSKMASLYWNSLQMVLLPFLPAGRPDWLPGWSRWVLVAAPSGLLWKQVTSWLPMVK